MFDIPIPVILFLGELILKVCMIAVVLLQKSKNSSAKLAWILIILIIPFAGTCLYLLVGTTNLGALRKRRNKKIQKLIPQNFSAHIPDSQLGKVSLDSAHSSIVYLAETVGGSHVLPGNDCTLFGESDKMIESLINDIDGAKDHCHILSYIMLNDSSGKGISEALIHAKARGVTCRLLLDSIGSKSFFKSNTYKQLLQNGVHVGRALPANLFRALFTRIDLRNHRKIAVIDNSIGYVGSQNIADASFAVKPKYAPWIDASVRIVGPITRELQAIFIQDWYMDHDENLSTYLSEPVTFGRGKVPAQLIATGPSSNYMSLSQLLQTSFFNASEELIISTPYFSPDMATESALIVSAKRGVKTHLVVPGRNDSKLVAAASKGRYQRLLDAGIQIHEFHGGLLHAKTMTIDRDFALIGSANLDRRSLELNFEVSMLVYDSDFASQLRYLQMSYIEKSTPVTLKEVDDWPLTQQLWQNAIGIIAPIL